MAVKLHSILNGRDVHFTINHSNKVQAKCMHSTCPWQILASENCEKTFQVKTFCGKHKCPRIQKLKHANTKTIAELYRKKIYTDPRWPIESMRDWIKDDLQVSVDEPVLYRAKQLVLKEGAMCESEEYGLLWAYAEEIMRTNPESTVMIKCKPTVDGVRFKRMYICWGSLKKGFLEGCRLIIFLDGCHLKTGAGGIMLSAVGIDGNNGVYPFAYAVVEKEKKKSWLWFMKFLIADLGIVNPGRWTIMSDKQKGLIDAIETLLPGCEHRFCVTHLYQNFKQLHRGLALKNYLWKAARAGRVVDFDKAMGEMKKIDQAAFEWLAGKAPAHWTRSHFRTVSLSDKLENNMSESFNAMILKARAKPIISMFETIRHGLMRRLHVRRDKVRSYHGNLCPAVDKVLEKLKKRAMEFYAHWNGENQFEVENQYGSRWRVHLGEGSCSCRRWDLTGIPCAHAISAIYYLNEAPERYVDQIYSRERFLLTYSHLLGAMNSADEWTKTKWTPLIPPIVGKMPGRPKLFKRKPQPNEGKAESSTRTKRKGKNDDKPVKITRKGSQMTCSLCQGKNHNVRSCPKKPSASATSSQRPVGRDIPARRDDGVERTTRKASTSCKKTANMANKGKQPLANEEETGYGDPLACVPEEWWNITSQEQASQLTQVEKQVQTPTRMTRSRTVQITEQSPRRVTPNRACKNKIQTDPKGTQESTAVKAVPARRKLQVRKPPTKQKVPPTKQKVTGTPLIPPVADVPSSKVLNKPDLPRGSSTLTSDVRFSKAPQQSGGKKMFVDAGKSDYHISPDCPPNCAPN